MSYGVRMYDSTGAIKLASDETFSRLVHIERLPPLFNGTFSVPAFDDNRGLFYPMFSFEPYTKPFLGTFFQTNSHAIPVLNWNNSTKVMTVAPASLPPGWNAAGDTGNPGFAIVFLHFG